MSPHPLPSEFADALARVAPRLGTFGHRVLWYPETTSTNDIASRLAESGAAEGCLVVADSQTAGRGRFGRQWSSPAGSGIYASVVLRPSTQAQAFVTLAAGVAIAEGIQVATGLDARVKWPNDIYVEQGSRAGRKLAGILAEAGSAGNVLHHVVVGFGINVMPAALPDEIAVRATSIESELGRSVDRGLVLAECLAALSRRYEDVKAQRTDTILAEWRRRAIATFGRTVEWDSADGVDRGVAQDLDDVGALLVRTDVGMVRLTAGEVRWI